MYGLCFRYLLAGVLQIATEQLPHKDLVLNFVIESGHSNAGAPAEIVRRVKQKQLPGVSEFLGEVVIGEKRRVPGLQAADGLASGAWHLERKGIPQLGPPTQPSIQGWNPRQTGWRVPIMRCHIDPPTLAELKKDHFALVEYRRAFGQRGSQEL
jgi:hypothetical protein